MFKGLFRKDLPSISAKDIKGLMPNINIIDIRESYELNSGYIKGSKNIPMQTLLASPEKYLDINKKYYIICQSGMRSYKASKDLIAKGYDIVNVKDGMVAYY